MNIEDISTTTMGMCNKCGHNTINGICGNCKLSEFNYKLTINGNIVSIELSNVFKDRNLIFNASNGFKIQINTYGGHYSILYDDMIDLLFDGNLRDDKRFVNNEIAKVYFNEYNKALEEFKTQFNTKIQ